MTSPVLKTVVWISAAGLFGAAWFFASPRTSAPGRILRWIQGEPGAAQWVSDTADTLRASDLGWRLEAIGSDLFREHEGRAATLPFAPHAQGRLLPLSRLPVEFQKLGGTYADPELILKLNDELAPAELIVSWGHMRQAIVVLKDSTAPPPQGAWVQKVTSRVYVVARES